VTPKIRDKDAAGAALLLAELTLDLKRNSNPVLAYLELLGRRFGYFQNQAVPVVMSGILGKENMNRMLDALRASPPKEIGGLPVTSFEDLRDEHGRLGPIKGATDAAARNVLVFRLADRARIILRPSGTEPKAKTYVEVCSPPAGLASAADWQQTRREVDELAERLTADFLAKALGLIGMNAAEAGLR
jgi:phosphoglucomutase/phosphomannomutase